MGVLPKIFGINISHRLIANKKPYHINLPNYNTYIYDLYLPCIGRNLTPSTCYCADRNTFYANVTVFNTII